MVIDLETSRVLRLARDEIRRDRNDILQNNSYVGRDGRVLPGTVDADGLAEIVRLDDILAEIDRVMR